MSGYSHIPPFPPMDHVENEVSRNFDECLQNTVQFRTSGVSSNYDMLSGQDYAPLGMDYGSNSFHQPSQSEHKVSNENNVDGNAMRRKPDDGKQKSPMKRARLSQMLEDVTSSSSSDEEVCMQSISAIPQLSTGQPTSAVVEPVRNGSSAGGSNIRRASNMFPPSQTVTLPMRLMSSIINPKAPSNVKSHLRKVAERQNSITDQDPTELSPATKWAMKQKKRILDRTQAGKIKAGWRVRQCLANLPDGETANSFFLECVKRGMLREVEAIFSIAKVEKNVRFDKNYENAYVKSALTIAVENEDALMMTKLLEHGVDIGLNLFHVIHSNFLEGLKLLLPYNPCIDHKIHEANHYYQIGMTPMLLAAHNNNYKMLSLLHEYGHRLEKTTDWFEGIHEAWESANERRMICQARAQPAYITLMVEVNNMNPMKYCLKEIRRLRKYKDLEHEFSSFYKDIARQLEEFMCNLLDLICSSGELASLFQYEYEPPRDNSGTIKKFLDGSTSRWEIGNRFQLLEQASAERLIRFVTHQQSQLALTYLRYRSMPFIRTRQILLRNLITIVLGLMFPILSLFYVIAPHSNLGSVITIPTISFSCHMMSDITFAILLLANISLKTVANDYLGASPSILEWLILCWIVGKWVQEIQECMNRGVKAYLNDNWNYTDIILLILFSISILIRIFDVIANKNITTHVPRSEWDSFEPRLIAEGLQAWAYVFVFMRLLGIMRVDRNLGPLQISLARMMLDILRFLCIFSLVLCAFAFSLSELYWYYGTDDGSTMLCRTENNKNETMNGTLSTCTAGKYTVFSTPTSSIGGLFWALFGIFDIETLSLSGKHAFTEFIGRSLVAVYHVVAIIVMLNMLIAMMSKSYEDTSENEESEWKFHRTSMWIRFIRREVIRPPPMNLFPNPWRLRESFLRLRNFCRRIYFRNNTLTEEVYDASRRRILRKLPKSRSLSTRDDRGNESSTEVNEISDTGENTKPREHLPFSSPSLETLGSHYASSGDVCCHTKAKKNRIMENTETSAEVEKCDADKGNNCGDDSSFSKRKNFRPAVLAGVRSVIRMDFKDQITKRVLATLIRRYKLKHLLSNQST